MPILSLDQVIKKYWRWHKCWRHHKHWRQKVLLSTWFTMMQNYSIDFKLSHENTFHHSMDISLVKRIHLLNILNCTILKHRQFFLTLTLTQVPYIQTLWSNSFHNFFTKKIFSHTLCKTKKYLVTKYQPKQGNASWDITKFVAGRYRGEGG